jgi:hypothetical protein
VDEHTDTLEKIDLDRLKDLLVICQDGGVAEVALHPSGLVSVKFHAPTPEAPQGTVMPARPVVDSPPPDNRGGYAKLLGNQLPGWAKAGG